MNRYFTTNVLRMFQNRKIYICTLGMALTLYMSGIAFIRSDGDSANLQDAFSVVSSSGFIYPVLSALRDWRRSQLL